KARDVPVPAALVTTDLRKVIDDPSIACAVEVVGGVECARRWRPDRLRAGQLVAAVNCSPRAVLDLLAAGKDVVTANKALLAMHGAEVFDAGRKHGKAVAFEASVAGGIPIIGALSHGLAANQILSVQGILNGTSNFILTAMSEQGA